MSKLYIANCTQQQIKFMYRIPEDPRPYPQFFYIRAGAQERLPFELSTPAIEAIVAAHAPYGLVRADEVDRTRPFIGMCYAVDKPVVLDKIRRALQHNQQVLNERGQEIRQAAAIAVNNVVEQQTATLSELELTIEEEDPDQHQLEGDPVHEVIRVSRDVNPDGSSAKTPERGKRRR